jgi:hypothetical protein
LRNGQVSPPIDDTMDTFMRFGPYGQFANLSNGPILRPLCYMDYQMPDSWVSLCRSYAPSDDSATRSSQQQHAGFFLEHSERVYKRLQTDNPIRKSGNPLCRSCPTPRLLAGIRCPLEAQLGSFLVHCSKRLTGFCTSRALPRLLAGVCDLPTKCNVVLRAAFRTFVEGEDTDVDRGS